MRVEQQFYDGLGRNIQTKAESALNTQTIVTDTRYDGLGHAIEQGQPHYVTENATTFVQYTNPGSGALVNHTTTTYDGLGRPIRITTPDTHWTEHAYGVVGAQTFHDVVDANRHRTQTRSDALGRLVTVYEMSGDCGTSSYSWASCSAPYSTAWQVDATTTYAYSARDQLTTVTDDAGNVTHMQYDSLGRTSNLLNPSLPAMDDPDLGNWNYTYDANGNLVTQTDAKGQTLWFGYDALNRQTQKRLTSASGALLAQYTYDGGTYGKGQRTQTNANGIVEQWAYDARGRTTSASYTVPGLTGTRVFGWTYDSADRLTSITYPAFPNAVVQTISYGYDAAWRQNRMLTSNWNIYLISGATYTALAQPDQWTFNSGLIQNWTYSSPLQRLSRLQVGSGTPASVFDRSYSYDPGGNVTGITDNKAVQPAQSYTYDERDRLTSWTLGSATQTYAYNAIGNLLSKPGLGTGVYSYPASGPSSVRPHTPTNVGGTAETYDANGNLTAGGGRTYTWTVDNLPASVSQTSGSESYTYDADGERVKKVAGSVTTVYLEGLWEEVVGGTPKAYYTFNGQTAVMYSYSPSAFTYLSNDHLGSVSVATNQTQAVVGQQEFDPWGKVRSGGMSATNINYTGQRLDGTQLLYYHARLYDPLLGRFVSADSVVPGSASGAGGGAATLGVDGSSQLAPLTVDFHEPGFVAAVNGENAFRAQKGFWFQLSDDDKQQAGSPWGPNNPQALNRYSYVINNPLRYTDPSGHCIFAGIDTLICIAVAVEVVEVVATVIVGAVVIDGAVNMVNGAPTTTVEKTHEGNVADLAKKTKQSGKEAATDIPSWAKGKGKQAGENGSKASGRIMDEQYGEGNWENDPQRKRERRQIQKNLDRKDQ